jgi:hypothetical protein
MADVKLVDAVVRGPQPYFHSDGVLYMPGQIVHDVPADDVSEDLNRTVTVEVEARNGDLRDREVPKFNVFAPLKGEATVAGPVDTAQVATGNPDMLNVTDFLKKSDDQIIASITSGSVDDHLGVIEQAIIAGKIKGRGDVKNAIAARIGVMNTVR